MKEDLVVMMVMVIPIHKRLSKRNKVKLIANQARSPFLLFTRPNSFFHPSFVIVLLSCFVFTMHLVLPSVHTKPSLISTSFTNICDFIGSLILNIDWLTDWLTDWLIPSFLHSFLSSFLIPSIPTSFGCSFLSSLVHFFARSFVRLFIHLLIPRMKSF